MRCPKCQMEQDDQNLLCDYCRTLFAKSMPSRRTPTEPRLTLDPPAGSGALEWLRAGLLTPQAATRPALVARAVLLLTLAVWGWRLAGATIESNEVAESFLHLVNLPFHEAGHVLFAPFGEFVRVLGGTLGQLIMPMVCSLVLLLRTRDPFGAGVALWWFGENFLDIAPYMNDAGTGELPLLGGNTGESSPYGFHDWEYLMTETGNLGREHDLARVSQALGTSIMLLALVWMATMLLRSYKLARSSGTMPHITSKAA